MIVVIDTVVLVRGLLDPFSRSGTLLFDRFDRYDWVVSPEIVAEYLRTIGRPELVAKYRSINTRDVQAILVQIGTAKLVTPPHVPAVSRDPNDDKFLAAALTGKAAYIVSEDHDLLDLGEYEGITILSAAAFLKVLDQSAG